MFAAVVDAVAVGDVIDVTVDAVALVFSFFCKCCSLLDVVVCASKTKLSVKSRDSVPFKLD